MKGYIALKIGPMTTSYTLLRNSSTNSATYKKQQQPTNLTYGGILALAVS